MNFTDFESKPVTRMAFQITKYYQIDKIQNSESTYKIYVPEDEYEQEIYFKAYEEPKVGDWIVRLTNKDTYHVTDAVFRERNIVPE